AVLYVISVIGYLELTKACGVRKEEEKKLNALEIVGILAVTGYYTAIYIKHPDAGTLHFLPMIGFTVLDTGFMISLFLSLILMMSVYVFSFPKFSAHQVMAAYFSLVYAPVMLSFVFLTRQFEHGIYLVWMIFISSWISDTCAYLVGVMIGRHKLAPVLSPKKSIEGSIGGIAGAALVGALFGYYLDSVLGADQFAFLLFMVGGVGSVISQIGDLAASAIKRNYDIKDYGKLIPGHGGIMDRFDSVIFTAPITYFLIIFFMR
ncbi:MAG: phosphatidate cytidylyltransferase, partial [Lachnospiraceae bacterium]|nr:phosphatidate cytidylyltransferase [Lachnospiraceae bacterium]